MKFKSKQVKIAEKGIEALIQMKASNPQENVLMTIRRSNYFVSYRKRGSWTGFTSPLGNVSSVQRPRSTGDGQLTSNGIHRTSKLASIVEKCVYQGNNCGLQHGSLNGSNNDLNSGIHMKRKSSNANSTTGEQISLCQLAKDGDYQVILAALDYLGPQARNYLNQLNEDRLSPLHYAARYNHHRVVQLLVERGAIVHIRGEDGLTPLHFAAKYNFHKKIKLKKTSHNSNCPEKEAKPKFAFGEIGLKDHVEIRNKPPRLKTIGETPKSNQTINLKVKNIGNSLQKFKNRKYTRTISIEDVLGESSGDGVVLTGSSNTLESAENCNGDVVNENDVIGYLVSQMAEVNSKDDYGLTPLHYAAMRGNRSAVKSLLLCQGVNIEARDAEEMTPLHLAAIHNNAKIAQLLINAGAQIRCRDDNLATPLHHAASEGNLEIIQMLIAAVDQEENWQAINEMLCDKDCEQAMPLHGSVDSGHYDCANYLINKGSDVNIPKQGSVYPLHLAAKNGDVDIVRLLLNNNKSVDCANSSGETPLHEAAKHNHVGVIDILAQNGANLEMKDGSGFTPLLTAAYHGHVEAIETLVSLGAKLHATDNEDRTAIYWATAQNKHDALMSLLDESPRSLDLIKRTDCTGNTPLHVATLKGYAVITQCLLDLGAPIELRNDMEQTPLHLAAWHGRTKIVKDLLWRNKAVINHVDEDGNTPLHIAALVGHDSVVRLFIDAGANLEVRNSRLWTPLDCASSRGFVNTVQMLLNSGCPIDPQEKSRVTPLHLAAATGTVEVVTLLLENGADITRRDDQMRNPLEIAIDNSRKDIARAIIQSNQWEKVLQCGTIAELGLKKTPMRKLIMKMPDIAEEVFQRCSSNNGFPSDHPLYTVFFNYEFIDDSYAQYEEVESDSTASNNSKDKTTSYDAPKISSEMLKSNHPLMIMVNSKRVHLLTHPLCVSLLHLKWINFGRYVYYTNFILYFIFLLFLTGYILTSTPPLAAPNASSPAAPNANISSFKTNLTLTLDNADNSDEYGCPNPDDDVSIHQTMFTQAGKYIIIVLATLHLIKELFQMFMMRWNYIGLENIIEWTCFTSSLLLTVDFTECSTITGIREKWQWEVGTISIFLAWVNLVMFISKFPYLGLYVVMFGDVIRTFCKVCVVFFLFIVAFAMGFYTVLYYNPSYSNAAVSIVRVVVMMLGEFQFDDIYQSQTLLYPGPAYFLFFIFMFLICIITMNLLVGLAVDDIKTVQAQANLKRLAMQVELVLDVESRMPTFLQQRFIIKDRSFMPNRRKEGFYRRLMTKINNTEALSEALASPEKYRENSSGVYRCKISEINKIQEQQEMLFDNNKLIEKSMKDLQIEHKKLHSMLLTLLTHHGVQVGEETTADPIRPML